MISVEVILRDFFVLFRIVSRLPQWLSTGATESSSSTYPYESLHSLNSIVNFTFFSIAPVRV
jgi:hypothetical protein